MTIMENINAFDEFISSSEFGGGDTEPQGAFHAIIKRAVLGQPIDWTKVNWQFYSSALGHGAFVRRVNAKAQTLYKAIRKAPISELKAIREYAYRADFDYEGPDDGSI